MITVYVGTEPAQYIAQKVLEYSILKNTKSPVEVRFQDYKGKRIGGTNFGFVRFKVPQMCDYQGKAIYMDADQLVFADVKELYDQLDDDHLVALVNQPEGFFGSKPVTQHNQTSVMVLNCEKLTDWSPPEMFKPVIPNREPLGPGQIHYRDFMALKWMDASKIKPIDPAWNHFNIINERTKLVHFSYVRTQPWKSPRHPLTEVWVQWLQEAIREGHISRWELVREVLLRHVHPYFLKFAVTA